MKIVKIKKDYLRRIKKLTKFNESYYNKNKSLVSDADYDLLKEEIINLEKTNNFLNHKDSPSKIVG